MPSTTGLAVTDVEYGRVDGQPLLARLYRPPGPGPFPAAVEVHGGAWNGLSYLADEALNSELARRGIFVASLEFRQPPTGRFPSSVRDVTSGLEWVSERRRELGLAGTLGFIGNSSGGHQALLTALLPGDPRFATKPPETATLADFLVLLWSVLDPVARYQWAAGPGGRPDLAAKHLPYWGDVATMTAGSPRHVVATGQHRHLPRILAIQGSDDENLPPGMLPDFVARYRAAGGSITPVVVPGRRHNFVIRDFADEQSQRAVDLIAEFITSPGGMQS